VTLGDELAQPNKALSPAVRIAFELHREIVKRGACGSVIGDGGPKADTWTVDADRVGGQRLICRSHMTFPSFGKQSGVLQ